MQKTKNKIIITAFILIIFGLGIAQLIIDDEALSYSERRKLAQAPVASVNSVLSGKYMTDLEAYLLDQFPLREGFRTINSATKLFVFNQSDTNGVYLADDSVSKIEYPLKENQVLYGANKINEVSRQYLDGLKVYYSIIPDKNYFLAQQNGYPSLDYTKLVELMNDNVTEAEYIDIFGSLTLEDYYKTDAHWKQESILAVLDTLANAMGAGEYTTSADEYTENSLYPFYGVYFGQSALPIKPDTLTYLTSKQTDSTVVTGIEFSDERPIYPTELFEGMDGYDVYLSGAQAVITLQSDNAATDRELIIFRDSFGSSLAPLFTGAYSKITLVDLRYINSSLLDDYVEFTPEADVLFIYSTSLINNAMLLK